MNPPLHRSSDRTELTQTTLETVDWWLGTFFFQTAVLRGE